MFNPQIPSVPIPSVPLKEKQRGNGRIGLKTPNPPSRFPNSGNERGTNGNGGNERNCKADAPHLDDERLTLTAAALLEESLFDAAQTLAAQKGVQLSRAHSGYLLSWGTVTRHYSDITDVADFVRGLP